MRAARRRNISVALPETNNTPVASSTDEEKISSVWLTVVPGLDALIAIRFPEFLVLHIPALVPRYKLLGVLGKAAPDLNKRTEDVRSHSMRRLKGSENRTAAEEGLEIRVDVCGEIRCDLVREALLVSDPLQELSLERGHVLELGSIEQVEGIFFHLHHGATISRFGILVNCILYWDT